MLHELGFDAKFRVKVIVSQNGIRIYGLLSYFKCIHSSVFLIISFRNLD